MKHVVERHLSILQDRVIGHSSNLSLLAEMLASSRMPHALLFSGPPSVGKQTTALAVAASALIEYLQSEEEQRNALALVYSGNHPDLNVLHLEEEKKNISVEAVRSFIESIQLKPYFGRKKTAIIDHAHLMSPSAANSLLKTLEEPPGDALIILVSEASHRLLPTILSRCQLLNFSFLTDAQISAIISHILESVEANHKLLKPLVELCDSTLQPLQLENYINPKTCKTTGKPTSQSRNDLEQHLTAIVREAGDFKARLKQLGKHSAVEAIQFVAEVGKDPQIKQLFCFQIRREIGKKLRDAPRSDTTLWAELLNDFLQAEQLVLERNANFELQLTPLMIRLAEAEALST